MKTRKPIITVADDLWPWDLEEPRAELISADRDAL